MEDEEREDSFVGGTPRPPSWKRLQRMIHWWLVARFGLNDSRDKDIWLYCIGAAMHLERMAVGVLWVADGRPGTLYEYCPRMSLGQAHHEIGKRGLLDPTTRSTLKAVADLRNSVGHRHAIFVTVSSPIEAQRVGEYKGYHVFRYRKALDELIRDVDAAARAMWIWIAAQAPDLAAEAEGESAGTEGDPETGGGLPS